MITINIALCNSQKFTIYIFTVPHVSRLVTNDVTVVRCLVQLVKSYYFRDVTPSDVDIAGDHLNAREWRSLTQTNG